MRCARVRSLHLPLQSASPRSGRSRGSHQGDLRNARALWLSSRACVAASLWDVNIKRTHRIYNELGLQLRNKTPKRRVKAKLRDDRKAPTQPNETWAMDFVHDQLATGNKLRTLVDPDRLRIAIAAADPLE